MKVAFISSYNPIDRSKRSGIVYSMYKEMLKYNEIIWVEPKVNFWERFVLRGIVRLRDFICHFYKSDMTTLSPIYSKQFGKALSRQLKNIECDYIFSYDCEQFAYIKTDKPIVYRTDSTYHLLVDYYYFNVPKFMNKKADKVQKKALEKCFAVVTPCDWVKDSIANDYHVDTTKVHVIESGANLEKIPPVYERIWSKEKFRMLFIGIDTKRKGVDVAIETAHILNEKYGINAMLTIVGGEISKELKQKKYIDWVGFLDKNNPKESRYFEQLIKESHLFIFPTMAECAGIVNCEASAYGLPILSYDTGGVGNYVINGVNGYRLPLTAKGEDFAKKIVKMFEANEFLKLSDGGRKLYEEKFNWETWGEKYHEEIEKLLK